MSLQDEIDRKAKHIHADGYSMSIGGLISLYRDDELDLHPEFQRFFRWDEHQKSRFVESILIGIPIPSIFVYQREDGVWDVIDGVQRLSTIFELAGILADEEGKPYPPLELKKTKYLPSLEGMVWKLEDEDEDEDDDGESEKNFTMSQRIAFKRRSLDVKIIMEDDDRDARFELFKRINMGGTGMSPQEFKRFLLLMVNKEFQKFVVDLTLDENFGILCGSKILNEMFGRQYDFELASKFLVLSHIKEDEIYNISDLSTFIADRLMDMARDHAFDLEIEKASFKKTFNKLVGVKDALFEYEWFSIAAFESFSMGLAPNIEKWENADGALLRSRIDAFYQSPIFKEWKDSDDDNERVLHLLPLSRELFDYEDKKC